MPGMAKDTPTISTKHIAAAETVAIVLRRRCSLRCLAAMRRFVSAKRSSWLRIALAEGVHEKVVRVAIERGLRRLEKILKNSL